MIRKVTRFIQKYNMIEEGDLVAAGVSGGADSLCLLFMLLEYRKKIPFDIVVVHVNHMIRLDAVQDAEFVRQICEKEKIPFVLKEIAVKNLAETKKLSEEEAGRIARYETFYEALEQYKKNSNTGKKIAVAHHQGDNAETLLFHLFRGTGITGMAGILPVNGEIIRPLLNCSRMEIEEFLMQKGCHWCIDSTNEEDTYTRNKIRHHILPYAEKEINENAGKHLAQAALQMAELREYLDQEMSRIAIDVKHTTLETEFGINIEKLKKYPDFLQNQFVLWFLNQRLPGRKDITSEHIHGIRELFEKNGSKRLDFPGNMEVIKEYDILWIRQKKKRNDVDKYIAHKKGLGNENRSQVISLEGEGEYYLENGDVLEISHIDCKEFKGISEKKYTKYLDYDKINSCLKLRYRQAGDFFVLNDEGRKKLLKEYFINEKIPAELRGNVPLIADGKHILWIIGYRISAYYKITKNTKKIIQMTIRRREHGRES